MTLKFLLCLVLPALVLAWAPREAVSRVSFFSTCRASLAAGCGFAISYPNLANAYERRDVGDPKTRSAATAAMNEQAYLTNNRLEASGFKLDTREEEQAKLSSAMASFSYDASTSSKKQSGYKVSPVGKGLK